MPYHEEIRGFHYFLILLCFIEMSNSQLRIRDGIELPDKKGDKKYMVYLTKSPSADILYEAWICGGAIVSKSYILTSAACVEDVVHMYAIAGYKQYVNAVHLQDETCTEKFKKKIVEYCVPSQYEFSFAYIEKWARIDIALAKVETPYNLEGNDPDDGCTWPTRAIEISYFRRWQLPEVDAVVYGWGTNMSMRKPSDPFDRNVRELKYATAHIVTKDVCKEAYKNIIDKAPMFSNVIDSYMICTKGKGNFDYNGDMINRTAEAKDGCTDLKTLKLRSDCMLKQRNNHTESIDLKNQLIEGNPEMQGNAEIPSNPEMQRFSDMSTNLGYPQTPGYPETQKDPETPIYSEIPGMPIYPEFPGNPGVPTYQAMRTNPEVPFDADAAFANMHRNPETVPIPYITDDRKGQGIPRFPDYSQISGYPHALRTQEMPPGGPNVGILRTSNDNNVEFSDLTRRQEFIDIEEDLRVPGICQNDHGGPLVTWVGSKEYLIGIASVFLIAGKDAECIGPFLYTSTHCNSRFLQCKLKSEQGILRVNSIPGVSDYEAMGGVEENITTTAIPDFQEDVNFFGLQRRNNGPTTQSNGKKHFDLDAFCNKPDKEKGFKTIEKKISWRDHPDGPSAVDIQEDKEKALREQATRQNIPQQNLNDNRNGIGTHNNNQSFNLNSNMNLNTPTYNQNMNDNTNLSPNLTNVNQFNNNMQSNINTVKNPDPNYFLNTNKQSYDINNNTMETKNYNTNSLNNGNNDQNNQHNENITPNNNSSSSSDNPFETIEDIVYSPNHDVIENTNNTSNVTMDLNNDSTKTKKSMKTSNDEDSVEALVLKDLV